MGNTRQQGNEAQSEYKYKEKGGRS